MKNKIIERLREAHAQAAQHTQISFYFPNKSRYFAVFAITSNIRVNIYEQWISPVLLYR
jgi:hypothetical protein